MSVNVIGALERGSGLVPDLPADGRLRMGLEGLNRTRPDKSTSVNGLIATVNFRLARHSPVILLS